MQRTVIVFGKHYMPALGAVRSLGEAGIPVELFYVANRPGDCRIAKASKYVRKCIEIVSSDETQILDALRSGYAGEEAEPMIFPVDDFAVAFLSKHQQSLSGFTFPGAYGELSALELMNKDTQRKLAQAAGFPCAREWVVDLSKPYDCGEILFPCFCKPLLSIEGSKQEMTRCDDLTALEQTLASMKKKKSDRSILIQEYLDIEEELDISGLSVGGKTVIAASVRKLEVARYNRGPTELGQVVDLCTEETVQALKRFADLLKYDGIFDIELFRCGDKLYFNELNLRPTGIIYGITKAGINLPALYARGELPETDAKALKPSVFISEKVADEDYLQGIIPYGVYKALYKRAEYGLIGSKADPKPMHEYRKITRLKMLKRQVKKFLSR